MTDVTDILAKVEAKAAKKGDAVKVSPVVIMGSAESNIT